MDAEIQAMDGNQSVVQMLESGNMPARSLMLVDAVTSVVTLCCHPWMLDFGIPAEMTAFSAWLDLCITKAKAPAWETQAWS